MRRAFAAAALGTAIAALGFPPATGAGSSFFEAEFEGRAERDRTTWVGFDLERQDGARRVVRLEGFLPYHCTNGQDFLATTVTTGGLRVNREGRFRGTLTGQFIARGSTSFTVAVRGRLGREGRARGTIDALSREKGTRCYTGGLDWRATRGADPSIPLRAAEAETDATARRGSAPPDNVFEGRTERDPYTYFGFDVVQADGGRKVAKVTALLRYHCTSGDDDGALARARGRLAVEDDSFAGRLRVPQDRLPIRARGSRPSMTYVVTGELRRGGLARGTIDALLRFSGAARGSGETRCYSGKLDWKAERGAEVVPTPDVSKP